MTAFRYLRQVPYRRSYNHNGRYYCLHEPSCYDRFGLWSWHSIHFSVDGSLGETVRRLVYEMEAGATHRELQERLRVRVHNALLTLLRQGEVNRERIAQVYAYLHPDPVIRGEQIGRRQALIAALRMIVPSNGTANSAGSGWRQRPSRRARSISMAMYGSTTVIKHNCHTIMLHARNYACAPLATTGLMPWMDSLSLSFTKPSIRE